jgi:hypothetical protein
MTFGAESQHRLVVGDANGGELLGGDAQIDDWSEEAWLSLDFCYASSQ